MEKWKERTVDRLRDYPLQKAALEAIPLELDRLRRQADRSPGQALQRRMEIFQMEQNLDMAGGYVAFLDRGLAALTREERDVLRRVYMDREEDVIESLRAEWELVEKRSVYKRLDKILYRLTLALFGTERS